MASPPKPPATSSANAQPVREPDTAFKKKYGPPPGKPNDNHSGLTPIMPYISSIGIKISSGSILRREERQRYFFHGFTAKQLLDLDANITTSRPLKPADLNFPIHPCFRRVRWVKRGPRHDPHNFGALGPGRWVGGNDHVWEILQPTLQLASLMLGNINSEFYDSLLHGPRTPIDPARFPDDPPAFAPRGALHTLRSFGTRGLAAQDPARQQSKDDLLSGLTQHVRFKFRDKSDRTNYNGCTSHGIETDANGNSILRTLITLDQKNYEPLLRPNLTASERFSYQWRTAVTLTHECSHAMDKLSEFFRAKRDNALKNWHTREEPYFNDNCLQGCGFMLEQFALGGVTRGECNPRGSVFPTIAFFWTEWPSKYWVNYRTNIVLKTPPLSSEYSFYPVPVKHFEDVHQANFWNYTIKAFDPDMLGLRSLTVRMQRSDIPPVAHKMNVGSGKIVGSHWKSKHSAMKLKQDMSADERRVCNAGDDLIERAKLSERFFYHSGKQEEELQSILEYNATLKERLQVVAAAAYSAAITPGNQSADVDAAAEIERSMQDQHDLILTAAKAHGKAVESYFALKNFGKAPAEVQKNLLLFNQSFRGFAREIAHKSWTDELIEDYEYIDELLEFKRQMLYSPEDNNSVKFKLEYREFEELYTILKVYSTLGTESKEIKPDIIQITDLIEKRWESSRYARTCAKIVRLAVDIATGKAGSPEETIQKMDAKLQVLISLMNGEDGAPCPSWKKTLDDMIQQMEKIIEDIRKRMVVPGTEDMDIDDYDPRDEDDIPTDNEMDYIADQPA
ncbi:hypothetical protein EYC80_008239 [Monilinia laxa]|uniref:Uncharacterized protein n=1 Tax=Monilinia laxa TaxID=61186 RepID=A0A5N6JTY5_MONLA|nr:hypothetical protein EYC80_008239 [Monilinia laxa]